MFIKQTENVVEKLKSIYKRSIYPTEKRYNYQYFFSPYLTDAEFESKPQVMLVGQYSVGKTSFIKYILGRDFPGQRIGPEPTTDRFTVVLNGPEERTIPGNALSVHPSVPYRGLEKFGVNFLNRFEGSMMPSAVLRKITLVDTPGILSGEKQRLNRGYDFTEVVRWFADKADLIIILFDAHKLDISDELRAAINALSGHDEKIRCILNKADEIDTQKLMRCYGALLWSMGKVVSTPEVLKVYVGSFWDQPLKNPDNKALFEAEERDLMGDLKILPRQSAVRKINELVKRIRRVKVLAYLVSHLKAQMPSMWGKGKKQQKLIDDLPNQFRTVMNKYDLAAGDFPDIELFRVKLTGNKFSEFKSLDLSCIKHLDKCLTQDIPSLMEQLPSENDSVDEIRRKNAMQSAGGNPDDFDVPINPNNRFGEPSGGSREKRNPFGPAEDDENYWALSEEAQFYAEKFVSAKPRSGLIDGATASGILKETGLPTSHLRQIWNLADLDGDGMLDSEEFTVAMYLADNAVRTGNVPERLEKNEVPPSKRKFTEFYTQKVGSNSSEIAVEELRDRKSVV